MSETLEKKVCKFPLTGELVEYYDQDELVPVTATQRLRLIDEILPHDREVGVTVYAFVEPIRVQLTFSELEYASQHLSSYYDLTNEDLLHLFLHHLPNFPDVFENPHPMVVGHFKSLPPASYDTYDRQKLQIALSANPSEEMFDFVLARRPDLIDWKSVVMYNPNRQIADRAIEHYRLGLTTEGPEGMNGRIKDFLHWSTSPEAVEFALSLVGGIDELMEFNKNNWNLCSHFLRNNSTYANAKKLAWLRDRNNLESDKWILDLLAACCDDEEILHIVLDKVDPFFNSETGGIWYNPHDLVVDYLIQFMKTHSPSDISPSHRCKIAWHKNPRVIQFLLSSDEAKGNEWIFLPDFLANSNDDATAYSLEWIASHYDELREGVGNISLTRVSECASTNKNKNMLMALYTQYPLLIEREDCEWLYMVGQNSEIGIDLYIK